MSLRLVAGVGRANRYARAVQQNRYPGLETLRGIAALMVALSHSLFAIKYGTQDELWSTLMVDVAGLPATLAKAALFFFSGDAAVTIFFVLSGTVLGLSLDRMRGNGVLSSYGRFMRGRVLRICPAHLVVLAVVCLLLVAGATNPGNFPGSTIWYNWFYLSAPGGAAVASNAVLLATDLNPVTWTLQTEMVASALLPILHAVSRLRARPLLVQPAVLALLIVGCWLLEPGSIAPHLYKFYIGLLLPLMAGPVMAFVRRFPAPAVLAVALFALLAENQVTHAQYVGHGVAQSLGAALIVLMTMSATTLPRFMRTEVLRRLGERSFSFYLWHFPVLWFTYWAVHSIPALQQHLSAHALRDSALICAITVVAAYVLAGLSYRYVEAPFIRMGRSAGRAAHEPARAAA